MNHCCLQTLGLNEYAAETYPVQVISFQRPSKMCNRTYEEGRSYRKPFRKAQEGATRCSLRSCVQDVAASKLFCCRLQLTENPSSHPPIRRPLKTVCPFWATVETRRYQILEPVERTKKKTIPNFRWLSSNENGVININSISVNFLFNLRSFILHIGPKKWSTKSNKWFILNHYQRFHNVYYF